GRRRSHRHRQGQQDPDGAGAAERAGADRRLRCDVPAFAAPGWTNFRRRARRTAFPADHPAHHGAAPRRARPARQRHTSCAAAFLRDPSAQPRRRFARDPGTARPRLALNYADQYRHRQRTAPGSVQERAPARVNIADILPSHRWPLSLPLALALRFGNRARINWPEGIMSAHESMEHAEHAEHASSSNKKIALLIAVIALYLAFTEMSCNGGTTVAFS